MVGAPELRFDHIGLVVASLAEGRENLSAALEVRRWTEPVDDEGIGVSVQFGVGTTGPAIELIAPLGENSPVAGALRSGGRILNHLAYVTADLEGSAAALREQGYCTTGPARPAVAYGGRAIQFFVSPLRFMVELIEAPEHEHAYVEGA